MTTIDIQRQRGAFSLASGAAIASPADGPPFALTMKDALRSLLVFLCAALLLLAADIISLEAHSGFYRVDVGNYRDKFFLQNALKQEATADGKTYRWSTERSTLWLAGLGPIRHALLTFDLGGRPQVGDLRLTLNDRPWAGFSAKTHPRHYTLLLPPDLPEQLAIGLHSSTFTAPGDSRIFGVKIQGFELSLLRERF